MPTSPSGDSLGRRELISDELVIGLDHSLVNLGPRAYALDDQTLLAAFQEDMAPWLKGEQEVVLQMYEPEDGGHDKAEYFLGINREALVQLVHMNDNLVSLQDLAPILKAMGTYREQVSIMQPGLAAGRVRLRVVFPPFSCTFEENRKAGKTDGDVVLGCVDINGVEHCGEPVGTDIRFGPDAMAGLEVCIQDR